MSRFVPNFPNCAIIKIEVFWVKQALVKCFAIHLNHNEYQSFTKKTCCLSTNLVYLKIPTFITFGKEFRHFCIFYMRDFMKERT